MIEYGHHFGEEIKNDLSEKKLSHKEVGRKYGISDTALRSKMSKGYFGNIYDLIKISILLNKDFLSPAIEILIKEGVKIDCLPNIEYYKKLEKENKELKSDLELQKETTRQLLDFNKK